MEHSSKKQVFVVDPIMNLVFPARAMRTVVGNMWGSRGPNIPWGRTATVLRVSELAARTACKWRTVTHTHTPFNGLFSGTTQVSRYQKGKTNLDFTEARESKWQWHQLGHMQVCTLLQTDNHTSTPPLCFLQTRCPSCSPTNSVKALKAHIVHSEVE